MLRPSNEGVSFPRVRIKFLQKPTGTTCRKARGLLLEMGAELEARDLDKQPLTKAELEELIGDCDYREFLNTRNEIYRTRKMKDHPPSRAEAINLMAKEPNLIRRPVVIRGSQMVLGFDVAAYRKLVK